MNDAPVEGFTTLREATREIDRLKETLAKTEREREGARAVATRVRQDTAIKVWQAAITERLTNLESQVQDQIGDLRARLNYLIGAIAVAVVADVTLRLLGR